MHHFFVKPKDINDGIITITGKDVKHITRSLRLDISDKISVADGESNKYLTEIIDISEEFVRAKIINEFEVRVESNIEVTLVQGLPKSKKMDLITQKCTELGIREIIPVDTKRTVVNLKPKKAERRQQRWQKIAREAAKQSGRAIIPIMKDLMTFKDILSLASEYDLVLMPWEDEQSTKLKEVLTDNQEVNKIMIIIGPEGGFSKQEVELAKEEGIKPVTLGPRILRTETAGIATLSMILYELGDLG
ncbi:16S rRNA (uracil(1498)-N(3))-methyltransferase [Orenia marismortui]|uniref:16S rRNA (uracil(1498)-N(3))-methyltransferase n=1 Tax=Orenia marismortui TaxID=46469 RepID=UPI0003641144|nr:16S rRNA (uracil(1498)-N(3))-methyltransferase [Orenia marismortui]